MPGRADQSISLLLHLYKKIHLGNEWNTLKAWWNKISIFSAFKGQELGYASMGLSAIGILCKRNGKEMLWTNKGRNNKALGAVWTNQAPPKHKSQSHPAC